MRSTESWSRRRFFWWFAGWIQTHIDHSDHLTTNSSSYHLETSHRRFKHCYVIYVFLKSVFLGCVMLFPRNYWLRINYILNLRHRHNLSLTRPAVSSRGGYSNSSERRKSSLLAGCQFQFVKLEYPTTRWINEGRKCHKSLFQRKILLKQTTYLLWEAKNPSYFIAFVKTRNPVRVKSTIRNKINSGSNPFLKNLSLNNEAKHGLQAWSFEIILDEREQAFFEIKSSLSHFQLCFTWRLCRVENKINVNS